MDEIIIWSVRELEQLLQGEAEDGSIVSVELTVDIGEECGVDG